jgi:hypothetical protein
MELSACMRLHVSHFATPYCFHVVVFVTVRVVCFI